MPAIIPAIATSAVSAGASAIAGGAGQNKFQAGSVPIKNIISDWDIANSRETLKEGSNLQRDFVNALNQNNGIQNQADIYSKFGDVAAGKGPNPAQAMLANATGANVANQAALMAGQRGASSNVGLMARQAAQQGAATQQQAAGQGAALQAQQSLNALGAQGNIAGQQVAERGNALQQYNQNALQRQGQMYDATAAYNNAQVGQQSAMNAQNNATSQANANANAKMVGGIAGGISSGIGAFANSGGGGASGGGNGIADVNNLTDQQKNAGFAHGGEVGPSSNAGRHLKGMPPVMMAKGGEVKAMLSPGEIYLPPQKAEAAAKGKASPTKEGKHIPGKAKVKGDSQKNDTVPATLEEGGVVIPRSVLQSKNPEKDAVKFVQAVMAKHGLKRK